MSTSQDDQIDQLVQARWRAIGLSQADLAEILCAGASLHKNGVDGTVKIETGRLATVAEMLGIAADIAVVIYVVSEDARTAIWVGTTAFAALQTAWYGFPLWRRRTWHGTA